MKKIRSIKLDEISPENIENIDLAKKKIATWSKEKRQAAKIIYEVKIEDGKSYDVMFAILAILLNPIVSAFSNKTLECGALFLITAVVVCVCACLWVCGRHRMYKNIAIRKILEEIDESELPGKEQR